jgi:hypothetical protein
MRLFELESLCLCRKYLGQNVNELDQKQINLIDKTYQRFIGLSKRIESKLNCRDYVFIYPDQYDSTQSENVLSSNWDFQIFGSTKAYDLQLGYSFCFANDLYIDNINLAFVGKRKCGKCV